MKQITDYDCKIDFILSNDTSLIQPTQTIVKSKYKKRKCDECNKRRKPAEKSPKICHVCYKVMSYEVKKSGNEVIDNFIRNTQISLVKNAGKMEFVPYDQFKDIVFIAEGGFSKVYKATWINGPVIGWNYKNSIRKSNYTVVLKKLNNSNNITSKELNELKIFYGYSSKRKNNYEKYSNFNSYVCKYFGITQDPNSQEIIIIMPYYDSGDLISHIANCFHNVDIGPVTNNPNAIYKSRNLSGMIQSAISLRSSRSQSINLELFNYYQKNNMGPTGKRKYENDLTEDKKDNDYITNELELDIDINISNEYITVENDFDISF
ncbi:uncharacterized protein OCT59_021256 [Rhizophagus irregularis]|uniref:uncharacterized protein n=1 Tax=Rhizophagus irregularis TaxID=588596 RepID=UPI003325CDA6|nr:hypothetical protein OCT59_021256 [Rhizophagus irregularis]